LTLCLTKHHAIETYHSLTKHHAKKTSWESGDIAPGLPKLDTTWRWVVSFTPRPP